MTSDEATERAAVVAAARSWCGTPYHHRAKIKGVGADCATLLMAAFEEAGLIPETTPAEIPRYSPQWHLNQHAEDYLGVITRHCAEIEGPPGEGDIVLFRFGHVFSHAGIVVAWPTIIHALAGVGVMAENAERAMQLAFIGKSETGAGRPRPRKFFSYWAKQAAP